MKRYLLFAGDEYYPIGGWEDFLGAYSSLEEANDRLFGTPCDWWQIVDSETLEVVEHN